MRSEDQSPSSKGFRGLGVEGLGKDGGMLGSILGSRYLGNLPFYVQAIPSSLTWATISFSVQITDMGSHLKIYKEIHWGLD